MPRKTRIICVETGREFDSIVEAAAFVGISPSGIYDALQGGEGRTSGGYHWVRAADVKQVKHTKTCGSQYKTIEAVQAEARRRTEATGRFTRYADIQKEETLRMLRERDEQMRRRAHYG